MSDSNARGWLLFHREPGGKYTRFWFGIPKPYCLTKAHQNEQLRVLVPTIPGYRAGHLVAFWFEDTNRDAWKFAEVNREHGYSDINPLTLEKRTK